MSWVPILNYFYHQKNPDGSLHHEVSELDALREQFGEKKPVYCSYNKKMIHVDKSRPKPISSPGDYFEKCSVFGCKVRVQSPLSKEISFFDDEDVMELTKKMNAWGYELYIHPDDMKKKSPSMDKEAMSYR